MQVQTNSIENESSAVQINCVDVMQLEYGKQKQTV